MRCSPANAAELATAGLVLFFGLFFSTALQESHAAFVPSIIGRRLISSTVSSSCTPRPLFLPRTLARSNSYFNNEEEEDDEDDDDDDDMIDVDALGDWRAFRRSLAANSSSEQERLTVPSQVAAPSRKSVSKENEELLETQSRELADEYRKGVWAHETSVPEVGGLLVRMPLEVEMYRNHKHSMTGRKLRKLLSANKSGGSDETAFWYNEAQNLIEDEMLKLAEQAADYQGQIDAANLREDHAELLQLYLDSQETWQEVCLVVERDEKTGQATSFVLNRPMALKLTENMAQLVLYGAGEVSKNHQDIYGVDEGQEQPRSDFLIKFLLAFGQECAVYIGGPDDQDEPAEIIHGIANLPGAQEISPGSNIYRGGLSAAVDGVNRGIYQPMDFRFFVGKHRYKESAMDVSVVLGKYQPIACARTLALKQCLSLPKPLWHEVLEMCGGELKEISQLEMLKRDDLRFQIVDEDDEKFIDEDDDEELDLSDLYEDGDGYK